MEVGLRVITACTAAIVWAKIDEAFGPKGCRKVIAYSPLLRRGDLALNAVLFRYRVLGERSFTRATRQVRGISAPTLNLFGYDAVAIAEAVYGDRAFAPNIAVDNSLFGIYLNCLSHEDYLGFIRENQAPSKQLGFPKLCSSFERNRLATSYLRYCDKCVSEDIDHQGFGSWRVIHQVPFMHHCPHHARILIEWKSPTTPRPNFLGKLPMPEDASRFDVQPVNAIDPSDGYMGYLKLWRLLSGHSLRPLAINEWTRIVTKAVNESGGLSKLTSLVEESVTRRWGMEPTSIGRALGIEKHLSVESELSLDTQPRNLARRLIVLDAMNDSQVINAADDGLLQTNLSFRSNHHALGQRTGQTDLTAALLGLAFSIKVRPSIALSLMKSSTFKGAMRMSGCPCDVHGRALIRACPDELLLSISRSFQNGGDNWAQRALLRRQGDTEVERSIPGADKK